jgi:hypothetical protein
MRQRERPINEADLPRIPPAALAQISLTASRISAMGLVFLVGLILTCVGLLRPVIQYFVFPFSLLISGIGVILIGLSIAYVFELRIPTMTKTVQIILAFIFGVVFVGVLMVVAIAFPQPSPFQYTVFRIVLALAAAGVAAMIPGLLEVRFGKWLSATAALAVFVIVYFLAPAALPE